MTPLQFETMMIVPAIKPERLTLYGRRDIVRCVLVCWAVKYHFDNSPFKPCDYAFETIGLDGVA